MKRIPPVLCLILLLATNPVPASAGVCPLPGAFSEGRIRSTWVGVLLDFAGEPGGPHSATVYTTIIGTAGGLLLNKLAQVEAHGDGAAALRVMFVHDRLYVVNERYAPGSTDHQYEYLAIQRFDIQSGKLIREAEGILNLSDLPPGIASGTSITDCSDLSGGFDKSLRKVIEAGNLDQIWTRVTNPH